MNQQINLYQPMFRKQKKVFSAVTMIQVISFFVFVFGALYGYELYRMEPFKQQALQLDKNTAELNAQLAKLTNLQPMKAKSDLLEKEIARLTNELEESKHVQRVLSEHEFGNATGFSSYLEALARQHVDGTWLTRVSIAGGGTSLGLEGKTLSSELVPIYIQQLSTEKALSGSSFNVMELYRPADKDKGKVGKDKSKSENENVSNETQQLVFKISTN